MEARLRLLIVQDSEDDARLLVQHLQCANFCVTYLRVDTPEALACAVADGSWDLVVAGYTLRALSALEALAIVREHAEDLPFIIVSDTAGEEAAVAAMRAGANDYLLQQNLTKLAPTIERELKAAEGCRARKRAEQALRRSEPQLQGVIHDLQVGVALYDSAGICLMANPVALALLGLSPEQLIGAIPVDGCCDVQCADGSAFSGETRPVMAALATGRPVRDVVLGVQRAGLGDRVWLQASAEPQLAPDGSIAQVVCTYTDITRRKEAEQALEHQIRHDALTGLPNRRYLQERLQQVTGDAGTGGGHSALLLMDIDHFKEINDTLGHGNGDLLLLHLGRRLQQLLSEGDTVARLGGDEFAILLPGAGNRDALSMARRILQALDQPVVVEDQRFDVSASIGIALYSEHGAGGDTLLRQADIAMYAAKQRKIGFAVYAPTLDTHSAARLALTGELRHAVESGQLRLLFQPIVRCGSGEVVGVEALVRWQHPSRGLLTPDHFIDIAEQTGAIRILTLKVLGGALRQCRAWRQTGLDLRVSVNLSVRNLQDTTLPDTVAGLLELHQVPAERLALEITESTLMADPDGALGVLTRLSRLGVRIAIDDFGTGYSSMAYLKRLPVDELKIDKSFIRDLESYVSDAAIVHAVAYLGHSLGLEVVAEGVEREETWGTLRELGCDLLQGYYFARPLPAPDVEAWIAGRARQQD